MSVPLSNPTSVDVDAPVVAHHEIDIRASLESVWNRHVDVNSWTQWNPDMTSAHLDGQFVPGATFQWESYDFPVVSKIYDVEIQHRILWGGVAGGVTGVHEWLFTPLAGGVRVVTNESFAGEPVEADPPGMRSALDSSLMAWLGCLKAASENHSADSLATPR